MVLIICIEVLYPPQRLRILGNIGILPEKCLQITFPISIDIVAYIISRIFFVLKYFSLFQILKRYGLPWMKAQASSFWVSSLS